MTRVKWQANAVFSVGLRENIWALGQMTDRSPRVLFFDAFAVDDHWTVTDTSTLRPLFISSVLSSFLRWSVVRKKKHFQPTTPIPWPDFWLRGGEESHCRDVTLWPGSDRELTVPDVESPEQFRLVPRSEVLGPNRGTPPVSRWNLIPRSDLDTLSKYERDGLWSFPALNERLWISYQMKQVDPAKVHNVDPDKCLELGLPVPDQCRDFFLMRQRRNIDGMNFIMDDPDAWAAELAKDKHRRERDQ